MRRSSWVKFQSNPDYIPSISGKNYETVNTQVEFEETLHPYSHMFIFQELIDEIPDAEAVIMMQLSLKAGLNCWKGKGQAAAIYYMNQLHFRYIFKSNHYRDLNEDQKKSILESQMFPMENGDGKIKGKTVAGMNNQRDFITKEYSSSPTISTKAVIFLGGSLRLDTYPNPAKYIKKNP